MRTDFIYLTRQLYLLLVFSLLCMSPAIWSQEYGYEETIRQDTGLRDGNFGPFQGAPVNVAHYFPSEFLEPYEGMLLHQIEFYIFAKPVYLEARVYGQGTENSPGSLLFSKIIPVENIDQEWVVVNLDIPIEISGEDIWIGYEVENEYATGCIGTDTGPANTGYGDWYSDDGENWYSFSTESPWLDKNWNIAGHLKAPVIHDHDVAVTSIIEPHSAANLSEEENIIIQIKNYGFETQSTIPYSVSWDDNLYEGVYEGALETEQSVDVTLPVTADLSEYGIYTFEACTNLPGDERTDLDCKVKEVENRVPELCTDNLYVYGCDFHRLNYWKLSNRIT